MAKKAALVFGIIFVIVGITGFIPNNPLASGNGLFEVNAIHNLVHIILGLILIFAANKAAAAALKWEGVLYLVVADLGFFTGSFIGLFNENAADNWLHLVLGIVLLAIGWSAAKNSSAPQM